MIQEKKISRMTSILIGLFLSILVTATIWAENLPDPSENGQDIEYSSNRLLVKFNPSKSIATTNKILSSVNGTIVRTYLTPGLKLVKLDGNVAINDAVFSLSNDPNVLYAEPDYIVHAASTIPNDPKSNLLWGLHQNSDIDIDAPEAWDLNTGSSNVIVAVIDSGVDYNHVDLADNMWTNPGEIPGNNIDDDANGWVDDVHGIDTVNNDGDPYDDNSHGTHCAGTIGAKGNNGIGVVGVNWNVSIMALKFLNASNSGYTSDAITCVDYASSKGAHLTSNSWGGGGLSLALKDSIENADLIFVAAAGNDSLNNNDLNPHYPSSLTSPQIISVLSTDIGDNISSFSNYGPTSVDVGAPGSGIYSTIPGNNYGYKSGTSMATPHVAGLAALIMAHEPGLINNTAAVKSRILNGVDVLSSLSGKCVTGGRINAFTSLSSSGTLTIDIKANNSDGPLTISPSTPLSLTINLNAAGNTDNADWWVLGNTPMGWYRFAVPGGWGPGISVTHQGPLFDLPSFTALNATGLPLGDYTFYFGVDTVMNSSIDLGQMTYDSVNVRIENTGD